jgi:hypothetical protein
MALVGKMVAKLFHTSMRNTARGVKFVKFDTSEEPLVELSAALGVQAHPAFHFFNMVNRLSNPITGYQKRPLASAIE